MLRSLMRFGELVERSAGGVLHSRRAKSAGVNSTLSSNSVMSRMAPFGRRLRGYDVIYLSSTWLRAVHQVGRPVLIATHIAELEPGRKRGNWRRLGLEGRDAHIMRKHARLPTPGCSRDA